jgi:hypothetical protein
VLIAAMLAVAAGIAVEARSLDGGGAPATPTVGSGVHTSLVSLNLPSSVTGTIAPLAIISPPDTLGSSNTVQNHSTAVAHGPKATAPIGATLPTGTIKYQTGLGITDISGANSSCFQPVIGLNGSPLGCLPPDVTMSASANYVVGEVNTAGEIWTTTGQFVKFFTLTNFYQAPSGAGCYITDPQVYFDNATQRWFSSVLSVTCGTLNTQQPDVSSQIYLAVSETANPAGSWFEYVIPNPLPLNLSDQPFLGVGGHTVVISTNQFPYSALAINTYTGAYFFVLDKLALEQSNCGAPLPGGLGCSVNYQAYGPYSYLASIHPAHSYGAAATEFMASANAFSYGQGGTSTLNFFAVNGTPPTATVSMTNLTILPTYGPPAGTEPGSPTSTVNTDDSRITTGVYQNGATYWGANDGCTVAGESGVHDCLRIIEVTTTNYNYQVAQDFDFNTGSNQDDYYPGLTLTPAGDVGVTFAFSSPSQYPTMAISVEKSGGKGFEPPTAVALGHDDEQGGRYGDYCDASPSYANPNVVWFGCEYILNFSNYIWNTHIESVTVKS